MARAPARFKLQRCSQKLLPKKRVAKCHRWTYGDGTVRGRCANGRAEFTNLQTCGSVWDCPVCAAKIGNKRSSIVLSGMERAKSEGYIVELLTLTVPHFLHQPAKAVVGSLVRARSHLKRSRAYAAYKAESGLLGEIWATEVTFGRNGWHPHCHALVFSRVSMLETLRDQWTFSVEKSGLGRVNHHGFRVDSEHKNVGEYVSKWGLEHELARGDLKKSRFGGRSPFELLRSYGEGDAVAGEKFVEYSSAFHGRQQLLWTNGLKAALGVGEVSDEELAAEPEIDPAKPCEDWFLDQSGWMVVLGMNMRGELLRYVAMFGQAGADALVAMLKGYPNIDDPHYYAQRRGRLF